MSQHKSKDKIIESISWLFLGLGLFALVGFLLTSRNFGEVQKELSKVIAISSLPVGLLLRGLKYLANEREKLLARIDELEKYKTGYSNDIEVIHIQISTAKENIDRLAESFKDIIEDYQTEDRKLDRRLVEIEARTQVSSKLGEHEARLMQIDERINKLGDLIDNG